MIKINMVVPTGENALVDLVRYFNAYDKKYLVYTLNEKDEQGFVKLYVARISESNGIVGEFIDDDNEWKMIKEEFKKIIGENSDNNSTSVNDLNPDELQNLNVKGHRVIKLMENYVKLLSANQKSFISEAPTSTNNYDAPSANLYEAPAPTNNYDPLNTNPYKVPTSINNYDAPSANSYEAPVSINNYDASSTNPYEAPTSINNFNVSNVDSYEVSSKSNYEEMYNELKAQFERCNAELEKVTNENVELLIKLDDIREILNEN